MNTAEWVDRMAESGVLELATAMDMDVAQGAGTSAGSFPCPVCGEEKRHGERKRGACGIRSDNKGWRCHQCGTTGDALDLAAINITGERFRNLSIEDKTKVRSWCKEWLGMENTAQIPESKKRAAIRIVRPEIEYPSKADVDEVWNSCKPVTDDTEVVGWLVSKGIDAWMVADRNLARALPMSCPAKARGWVSTGNRLIVPMRNAAGEIVSLKARDVTGTSRQKSLSPTGKACSKLSFFEPGIESADKVMIVEGEKKWLQMITRAPKGATVIGVGAGLYSSQLIRLIKETAEIFITTDPDHNEVNGRIVETGARYATDICKLMSVKQFQNTRLWNRLEFYGNPSDRMVRVANWAIRKGGV